MAGARRQVDDGKGGQWRSVAISRVRILLVNKHFVFRSNRNFGAGIGGEPCGLSSVVSPDVFLFRDSVRENIRLG